MLNTTLHPHLHLRGGYCDIVTIAGVDRYCQLCFKYVSGIGNVILLKLQMFFISDRMICLNMPLHIHNQFGTFGTLLSVWSSFMHSLYMDI